MPAHDITTSHYLEPAVMTTPGTYRPLLAGSPPGIAAVAEAAHGLYLRASDRIGMVVTPSTYLTRLRRCVGHRDVRFPPGIVAGGRHAGVMTQTMKIYEIPEATGTTESAGATGTSGLLYQAIAAGELDALRAAGRDEAGNPLEVRAVQAGGSPLRCCLREARPGERLLLIAYTPPGTAGAYAERGPVFVHAERCDGYLTTSEYPPELAHRQQVVRAYDRQGQIADGVLAADGRQAQEVIEELLARPGVQLVHLRNVGYGCYNFAVRVNSD